MMPRPRITDPAHQHPLLRIHEANIPASGRSMVAVKAGDWIKLDYRDSGAPSGPTLPTWIRWIPEVEGTTVEVRVSMHMSDGH